MSVRSTNMAASCLTATRTGAQLVSCRLLLLPTPTACHRLRLHMSPSAGLWSSRTEPQGTDRTRSSASGGGAEEELGGPEYIPRRKAKNPMMKIGYAWMIGLPTGVIGFLLAKRQVDKNRLKQLKIRQRMKRSNDGDYDGSRYHRHSQSMKLD